MEIVNLLIFTIEINFSEPVPVSCIILTYYTVVYSHIQLETVLLEVDHDEVSDGLLIVILD